MYVLLIVDNQNISLYTIGEFAKVYYSIEEAENEIKELRKVESDIFGERNISYQIVEVG